MKQATKKQISFILGKIRTMKQVGGKGFRSWLFVMEDPEGKVYKTFHPVGNPLMLSDGCIVTGTHVKDVDYLGEKQVVFKSAKAIKWQPEQPDTEEVEGEALGDNIALHRQDNPYWWVIEGREDIIEEDVCFQACVARTLPSATSREHAEAEANEQPPFHARSWAQFIDETENR